MSRPKKSLFERDKSFWPKNLNYSTKEVIYYLEVLPLNKRSAILWKNGK